MGRRFALFVDRLQGRCDCCKQVTPAEKRFTSPSGGFICDLCMQAHCYRQIFPLPDHWEHRVGFTVDGDFIAVGAGR